MSPRPGDDEDGHRARRAGVAHLEAFYDELRRQPRFSGAADGVATVDDLTAVGARVRDRPSGRRRPNRVAESSELLVDHAAWPSGTADPLEGQSSQLWFLEPPAQAAARAAACPVKGTIEVTHRCRSVTHATNNWPVGDREAVAQRAQRRRATRIIDEK